MLNGVLVFKSRGYIFTEMKGQNAWRNKKYLCVNFGNNKINLYICA